jgi:hypothetical protein
MKTANLENINNWLKLGEYIFKQIEFAKYRDIIGPHPTIQTFSYYPLTLFMKHMGLFVELHNLESL